MSMSASDWTRMQRRKAGTQYAAMTMSSVSGGNYVAPTNQDTNGIGPTQKPYGNGVLISRDVGSLKTARPASDWTNYVASQVADYTLKSSGTGRANEDATTGQ